MSSETYQRLNSQASVSSVGSTHTVERNGTYYEQFTVRFTDSEVQYTHENPEHLDYLVQLLERQFGLNVVSPVRAPDFEGTLHVEQRVTE